VLVRTDLSGSVPLFVGADPLDETTDDVTAGVVHLGVPFDERWSLAVDGTTIEPRRAFGETTAFDIPAAGVGELRYDTSMLRWFAVAAQVALWLAAIVVAARVRVSVGRRDVMLLEDETLIDLTGSGGGSSLVDPGLLAGPDTSTGAGTGASEDRSGDGGDEAREPDHEVTS
jgi:hypothetical protein